MIKNIGGRMCIFLHISTWLAMGGGICTLIFIVSHLAIGIVIQSAGYQLLLLIVVTLIHQLINNVDIFIRMVLDIDVRWGAIFCCMLQLMSRGHINLKVVQKCMSIRIEFIKNIDMIFQFFLARIIMVCSYPPKFIQII